MRTIRWAILFLLAGATAVFLATAVYAYHIATPPYPTTYSQQGSILPTTSAIDLIMEEGGLALVSAARLLTYDWRRTDFSFDAVRLSRISDSSRYVLPGYEPKMENAALDLPGPVTIVNRTRPAEFIEAKASTPCPPSALNRRVIWSRPWPTTPNPATVCLCPEETDPPLLASAP